jgi:putative DNA primase/helicase
MKSILLTRHIKLWIVDNLASLAGGLDENLKKDWDPINTWLLELRFAGIATILLHHTNKEGTQRGTSAREDNIDVSIMLKRPSDYSPEDGCRFITSFTKARVSLAALPLIGETEFKLIEQQEGEYSWSWANVKRERKREILKMLDEGMEYPTIRATLDVAKSYITKVKQEAIKQGFMNENGRLTELGKSKFIAKD